MGGSISERCKSYRSHGSPQLRLEGSSGLTLVSRHSQDELRIREYQPYELQRRCVEDSLRSRFRMGDVCDFDEGRAGQMYLNLLLDKLR